MSIALYIESDICHHLFFYVVASVLRNFSGKSNPLKSDKHFGSKKVILGDAD